MHKNGLSLLIPLMKSPYSSGIILTSLFDYPLASYTYISWNKTSVTLYSSQLLANASVATAMAVEMLPEFGINVSSIRSVGVELIWGVD